MKKTLLICSCLLWACSMSAQPLKEALGKHFMVGCAVNSHIVRAEGSKANDVVCTHFNSIVAENCMKPESICPEEGKWNWQEADQLVAFGEKHGMTIIGHTLVWHSQAATWMFKDEQGRPASRELLIERMRTYIHAVVGRYKGRVYGWDVCNECFLDDGSMRDSEWRRIIGDDFIELAFRFAHEADPDAELYYNDYSMANEGKYRAVCRMVEDFRTKGIRIDAVGMQSHNGLSWPRLADYEKAMTAIAATGVKINISELDLNVLPTPEDFGGAEVSQNYTYRPEMDPYADGMDDRTRAIIGERWQAFFLLYREHAADIKRVTFWGVSDTDSWLGNWPIHGRHPYALLFDTEYNPKQDYIDAILRLF